MMWAWISLFYVGFVDLYIRLCAMGIWHGLENSLAHGGLSGSRIRRPGGRRGRRGIARGDRSVGCGREDRRGHEIAARQGAHGDGRRRHGGGDGQRGRSRQLARPLRRHHARRPVPEQLPHGGAAREGSAGARAGTGSLGRDLRSHQGRPHSAAQLRRASLSAPGARGRSHRSRNDPHAAGSRHPSGHRRVTPSTPSSRC